MTVLLCQTSSSAISSASALNYAIVSKYGKVLIRNIITSIWFRNKEEAQNGAHSLELQKAHPSVSLLLRHNHLASRLATMVSE